MNFDALHNARNATNKKFGLTDKGLRLPRYADYLEIMIESYEAEVGVKVNREPGDALFSIFVVCAKLSAESTEILQAVYDQQDPNNATGIQLDNLCNVSGIRRHKATFSRAVVDITGDPGVTVPDGKRIEDSGRNWWMILNAEPFDGAGNATAFAVAAERGPIAPAEGSSAHIVNPVFGWASVKFKTVEAGRHIETDSELRLRRALSLRVRASGSCAGIRARLLELPFIKAAVVLENDTGTVRDVEGILAVPPHSVIPIICTTEPDGKTTGEQTAQVARMLYRSVVAGIQIHGIDHTGTITAEDGGQKVIKWTYAPAVPVDVVVTVSGIDVAKVQDEITKAVTDYFDGLQVGDAARRLRVMIAAGSVAGVVDVEVTLNGAASDVVVSLVQSAQLGVVTVTN